MTEESSLHHLWAEVTCLWFSSSCLCLCAALWSAEPPLQIGGDEGDAVSEMVPDATEPMPESALLDASNRPFVEGLLSRLDEHAIGAFNDYMTQLLMPHALGQITYLQAMTRVIWGLARQGRAVILGRGANWILNPEYGLRLRVVASLEERVARVADKEGLSIADSEKQVRGHDAEQIAFIRQVFDRDINDPLGYDVMLNLGSLDIDQATQIAIAAMRHKLGTEA